MPKTICCLTVISILHVCNKVTVEVSIRADKEAPADTIISLQFIMEFGDTMVATKDTLLQVKELTDSNNPQDTYTSLMKMMDK